MQAKAFLDILIDCKLVISALMHLNNLEILGSARHHGRVASADDAELQTVFASASNAVTVLCIEAFHLCARYGVVDPAIGHDAVHIQQDEFDATGFRNERAPGYHEGSLSLPSMRLTQLTML